MEPESPRSKFLSVRIWLFALFACGLVGMAAVGSRYTQFLDCSLPELHESANTPFGWSVATLATGVPLLVALWFRPRPRWLLPLAVFTAGFQITIWAWALNPGGCDWA